MRSTLIQPADPAARRKAMWVVAITALLGSGVILLVTRYRDALVAWLEANIDFFVANTWVVFPVFLVLMLPLLAAGVYLMVFGQRIVACRRFPPAGYAVVRDTRVIEGRAAVARGRILQLSALLMIAAALVVPAYLWWILRSLPGAV